MLPSKLLMADTPNFDFFEYGYTRANFDGISPTLNGVDWSASFTFGDNFFVATDYFKVDTNGSADKLEIRTYGVGYQYALSNSTALYSEIAGTFIDPNGSDNHEKGFEFTGGIRSNINHNFELKAAIKIFNTKTYDMTTLDVGVAYNISASFAIYSDLNIKSKSTRPSIGARYSF